MGFIVGFSAIDANGAVIVWRANGDGPSTSWVSRVDGHGEAVWVQPLPEVAMSVGGTGPVTIVDGVAVVRYGHRAPHQVGYLDNAAMAFALADGHVLWDRVLAQYVPPKLDDGAELKLNSLPMYASDVALGNAVISFSNDGGDFKTDLVTRTVARTGVVSWTHLTSSKHRSPVVSGGTLSLHDVHETTLLDGATGAERTLQVWGTGCALGAEYLAIEETGTERQVRLVAYPSVAAGPRVINLASDAFDGHPLVRSCGHHGDQLVFLVEASDIREDPYERVVEVVTTDRDGKLLHRISLGAGPIIMDSSMESDPAHAPIGGDLPRFVLHPVYGKPSTLVMLDLETGTVAWRGKPDESLQRGVIVHIGTRWLWSDGAVSPTVALFDGTTGKLVTAVNAYSYEGVASSTALSRLATDDTLWLYSGDWTSPGMAPVATLDLATLTPRFVRAVEIHDVTTTVRAKLGI